jgi:Glycosyltransferase family 87
MRYGVVLALGAAVLFLVCCLVAPGGVLDPHFYGDIHIYRVYGHRMADGRWPYRDFYDEYPPLAQLVFWGVAELPGTFAGAFKWTMALLGAGAVGLLVSALAVTGASRRRLVVAAASAGVAPIVLGKTLLSAYDLWPAFLLAAALLAFVRRRDSLAFVLLALAVAAKIYPLAVLPLGLVAAWQRGGRESARRGLLWFVGTLVVVHLPFAVVGPGGLRFSYWTQLKRGLEVESLGGSILLALERVGAIHVTTGLQAPGSTDVEGSLANALGVASTLLEVAAVLLVAWLAWRRRVGFLPAAAATVLAMLAFSKVFSPQYADWLVPIVPAAGSIPALGTLVVLGLTHVVFDRFHTPGGGPNGLPYKNHLALWALARNLALVALYVTVVVRLARRAPSDASTPSPAAQSTNSSGRLA